MKRSAFTLLELVISCTLLVGIFSILAVMVTRVHRLRDDDEIRIRLRTQGRALLDRLESEIRDTCGTNLTPAAAMAGDRHEFSFVRVKGHPRGTCAGEAATDLPFERITYSFDGAKTGGFSKASSTWRPAGATGAGTTNYATEYRFTRIDGDALILTNVHPATDRIVLPAAGKGGTITIPVTSGSSKRIYDTVNRSFVHVDIVPTETPLTNRVHATVSFTNAFSSTVTKTLRRPVAVDRTEARTGRVHVQRRLDLFAETRTDESALLPLVLPYADAPSARAVTNAFARVASSGPEEGAPPLVPVATTIWSLTNLPASTAIGTGTPHPEGLALFFIGEPVHEPGLWRSDRLSPASTTTPRGKAETMDGVIVGLDSADLLTLPWPVPPSSVDTNLLRELIPPMAFDNRFTARTATNGPALPLAFHREETVLSPDAAETLLCELSGKTTAIGLDGDANRSIIRSLWVERFLEIDLDTGYDGDDPVTTCATRFRSVSSFRLQMDLPSSMAGTNRYEYLQDDSDRLPKGISRSRDTTWETVPVDDDRSMTALDLIGLWLEETKREGSEWDVEETKLYRPLPGAPVETEETKRFDATASCVERLRFIPLSFRKDGNDLVLVEWDPSSGASERPVCVDIYLELIAPIHRQRAMAIPDRSKREEYAGRHRLRMTRRVPLNHRTLWSPPR